MLLQQREVLGIARARWHLDVEIAALLLGEEVARAVQREGCDAWLVLEEHGTLRTMVHSTYYGAILTMALYSLWRYTYDGALLTMALYLLWRFTYYGAILTMAFLEEHCASVALVHVEVDHQDALYSCRVVAQCHARRHADVWLGLGLG